MKPASFLATVFLAVVALAHLARLLLRLDVQIGRYPVPPWMSVAAFLFCGVLALLLCQENRAR